MPTFKRIIALHCTILIYSAMALCVLLPVTVMAQTVNAKGAVVAATTENNESGNTWAVIVGISKYKNIQSLNYADRDALAFYDYLKNKKGVDSSHIKLYVNEAALSSEIYGALAWLGEIVKPNDRVIFYFSGHGDVETKTIYQNGFLLAYDAPIAAYMTMGTISVIYLQQYLETYIAKNKAKDVLLIVDACRSGKLAGGTEGVQVTMHALGQSWNNQIIKILSAQEGEASFEDKKWGGGRGVFSYYLIKGIEGMANKNTDNIITTAELAAYLPFAVSDATDSKQNPVITGNARQSLFTFDDKLMALAKKSDNIALTGNTLAARGKQEVVNPQIKMLYQIYSSYLQIGYLLWGKNPADTLHCAKYFYKKLIHDTRSSLLIPSLKSSFLAALEHKTDVNLDNYINGGVFTSSNTEEAYKELMYAKSITDTSYVLYNYLRARILFTEGARIKDRNKAQDAIKVLKKVIEIEPDAAYAYNEIGSKFDYLLNIGDSAIYYYKKAIEFSPKWPVTYNEIAFFNFQKHNFKEASYYHKLAIESDPSAIVFYVRLADDYRHLNEDKKADSVENRAILIAKKSLDKDSTNYNIYIDLADLYLKRNDYNQAIILLNKVINSSKSNYYAYELLGTAYLKKGDNDKAISNFSLAINLKPNYNELYNAIAIAYRNTKNPAKAIENYRKAIALNQSENTQYLNLIAIYLEINDYPKAINTCNIALKIHPEIAVNYYVMACALSLSQDKNKALDFFEEALKKGFNDYDNILTDTDLTNIKKLPQFKALLKKYFPARVK